ncbi:hypothetical protein GCM10007084_22600 [Parabacteroides faecis]|nr:hypothetical protein GCM10007084_22600 [Parabacteroides faecis]
MKKKGRNKVGMQYLLLLRIFFRVASYFQLFNDLLTLSVLIYYKRAGESKNKFTNFVEIENDLNKQIR